MKKTLIAVAAAAALTTSAFAELSFGTWTNSIFTPVANDGLNTVSNMGMSWGGTARTGAIDFHFKSEDELAGMDFSYRTQANNTPAAGDYSQIWVKPIDVLTLSYGKYDNNTLRGDICYGAWNWLRPTSAWIEGDEGLLMSGNGKTGVQVEVTPVDGLYIQAVLPVDDKTTETADVFKNMQAGFAYNIEGVGKIKAQLILKNTAKKEAVAAAAAKWVDKDGETVADPADFTAAEAIKAAGGKYVAAVAAAEAQDAYLDKAIEAEFDLTSVENLWVGVGFKMTMIDKMEDRKLQKSDKMKIALGATYQVSDELKVSASGAYFMYQKSGKEGADPRFQAGAGVDYNLGDGMNLSADVRYLSKAKVADKEVEKSDHIAFSVGVTKGIGSNAMIGAAFQGTTNSGNLGGIEANGSIKADQTKKNDKLVWAVPVRVSMWF
ncbi:hypothetical protein [Treponema sp.]|uniref:hypothetical protein n=1 Tax=Treponema sp. TaxID=166 RepID=UPI00388D43E6